MNIIIQYWHNISHLSGYNIRYGDIIKKCKTKNFIIYEIAIMTRLKKNTNNKSKIYL